MSTSKNKKIILKLFFSYFSLVAVVFFVYSSQYNQKKEQKEFLEYSNKLYDFDISKKYLSAKLDNMFFEYFNDFVTRKAVSTATTANKATQELLETLLYNKYEANKELLKDLAIYNLKAKKIMGFKKNLSCEKLDINNLKQIANKDDIFFECALKKSKHFIKIKNISLHGKVVGYMKFVVDFDTFMLRFLSKYKYNFIKKTSPKADQNYLELFDINNKLYLLDMQKHNSVKKDFLDNSYFHMVVFSFVLFVAFYFIYKNINKEETFKEDLRSQKEFFKSIINTSPNAIFVKNSNHEYLMANNATAKLFDLDNHTQLKNKTNEQLGVSSNVIDMLKAEESLAFESQITTYKQVQKIGNKFYKFVHIPLHGLVYPQKDDMVIGFATNITSAIERKNELAKLNTKLKLDVLDEITSKFKINQKFKKIFDNISDAMFVCEINENGHLGSFVDINSSGKIFLQRFNYNNTQPKDIFTKLKYEYNEKLNIYMTKKYSYVLKIGKNNNKVHFKVNSNLMKLNNKYFAIIFVQHIDEIIKLKKDKKENQILISNIFEKAKMGIAVIDYQGKIVKYNNSFYSILNLDNNYFEINDFFSIFEKSDQDVAIQQHKELFQTKKDLSVEYSLVINDKKIDILSSSTIIFNSDQTKLRLFIFEDITKQKQMEQEHIRQNRILTQQSKMAEMGEMIGAIAHQWRQPLNAINAAAIKLNFSSSLGMVDTNEVSEKSKFIEEQSLKMSETINDFMYFFKPSKRKDQFFLDEVYKKIFTFLEAQLKSRDIDIIFNCKKDMTLFGFKNEFEHILLNLINNAKDAFSSLKKESQKTITITAFEKDTHIVIKVEDNAGGIPDDIKNKIFNPYFTTKEEGKGTGIGLYMTKTIVEKHFNGSIKVENMDDGALFTINLPLKGEHNDK